MVGVLGRTSELAGAIVGARDEPVVVAVRATPTMREVPLGAFSLFLTAADETDEPVAPASSAAFTTRLHRALLAHADGRPLLLSVDDAHHLDPASTNLV